MSAKSCLLCGKPLSRIWVGSGEDFCSREHRNQYRLRRGMDRLLEANKLASLMRRRENLKPIPVPAPAADNSLSRHGFEKAPTGTPVSRPLVPRLERSETSPRVQPAGIRILPQARPFAAHRELRVPAHSAARIIPIRARDLAAPPTAMPRDSVLRSLPQTPRRGLDLRVCLAAGFRIRPPVKRELPSPAPASAGLTAPKTLARLQPSNVEYPPMLVETCRAFPLRRPELPSPAAAAHRPQMNWPGLRRPAPPPPPALLQTYEAAAPASRCEQPIASLPRDSRPTGLPGPRPARIFALPPLPAAGAAGPRTATVPFKPADAPFGYGTEDPEHS